MKILRILGCMTLVLAGGGMPGAQAQQAVPKTDKEKLSYAIGMQIGEGLKKQGIEVDTQMLSAALRDSFAGTPLQMTDVQMRDTLMAFGTAMQAKQQAAAQALGAKNKADGEAFLATNKTKPDVKTLPDGLEYQIITEGSGATPTATDTVSVNYAGTLIDGKEFDSSYKRGEPAKFPVTGVIKGWTEALQLMKVGSKWKLFIPSTLAYGERGTPDGSIPPNSTLIFDVELLGIQGK